MRDSEAVDRLKFTKYLVGSIARSVQELRLFSGAKVKTSVHRLEEQKKKAERAKNRFDREQEAIESQKKQAMGELRTSDMSMEEKEERRKQILADAEKKIAGLSLELHLILVATDKEIAYLEGRLQFAPNYEKFHRLCIKTHNIASDIIQHLYEENPTLTELK